MNKEEEPYRERFYQQEKRFLERINHIITAKKIPVYIERNDENIAYTQTAQLGRIRRHVVLLNGKLIEQIIKRQFVAGMMSYPPESSHGIEMRDNVDIQADTLSLTEDPKLYSEYLKLLKGLNYHEVSHILYSPAFGHVLNETERKVANMLEDQRIELLFIQRFPNAYRYFANNIIRLSHGLRYVNVYGRRFFLPRELVSLYRKLAIEQEGYTEREISLIEELIDRYLTAKTYSELIDIIKALTAILKTEDLNYYDQTSNCHMPYDPELSFQRSERLAGDKKKIAKLIEEERKKEKDGKGGNGDIEEEQEEQGDEGSGEGEKEGQEGEEEQEGQEGEEEREGGVNIESKIQEILEQTAEEIDRDLQREIQRDMEIIGIIAGDQAGASKDVLVTERKELKDKLKRYLKILKSGLSEGYIRRQKTGRFDMRAVMCAMKNGNTRIFKKYKPSRVDKLRIALCIEVDGSGSMSGEKFKHAIDCAWMLSHALEELGSKVAVTEYSDGTYIYLKKWNEKMGTDVQMLSGGTDPGRCLKEAFTELKRMRNNGIPNLINICITDGDWYSRHGDWVIEDMNNDGVETIEVIIGSNLRSHGSKHIIRIYSADELPEKVKGTIEDIARDIRKEIV